MTVSSHRFSKHMNWLRTEVSVCLIIKNKNLVVELREEKTDLDRGLSFE